MRGFSLLLASMCWRYCLFLSLLKLNSFAADIPVISCLLAVARAFLSLAKASNCYCCHPDFFGVLSVECVPPQLQYCRVRPYVGVLDVYVAIFIFIFENNVCALAV
jgi:hypothetical protein